MSYVCNKSMPFADLHWRTAIFFLAYGFLFDLYRIKELRVYLLMHSQNFQLKHPPPIRFAPPRPAYAFFSRGDFPTSRRADIDPELHAKYTQDVADANTSIKCLQFVIALFTNLKKGQDMPLINGELAEFGIEIEEIQMPERWGEFDIEIEDVSN